MVILGAILLVTIPSITKTLKNKKEEEYQRFLSDIYLATESYIGMRRDNYPELVYSTKAIVEIKELIEAGYISENKINPKTNEMINPLETVTITKDDKGIYSYQLSGKENGFSSYIKKGLILWYDGKKHGENEYIWTDLSGNGRDGILKNYTNNNKLWTNNGLEFDGIDDVVTTLLETDFTPAFTLTTTYQTFTSNLNSFAWGLYYSKEPYYWYDYRLSGAFGHGNIYIASNQFDGDHTEYSWSTKINYPTILHSETVVVIPNQNKIKLYTNGTLINETILPFTINGNINASLLGIGTWIEHTNRYIPMNMKSIMIYNRELSQAEIEKNSAINEMRFGIDKRAAMIPET